MHSGNSFPQFSDVCKVIGSLSQQGRVALRTCIEDLRTNEPVKLVQPDGNLAAVRKIQRALQVDDESQDPIQVLRFTLDIVLIHGPCCRVKQADDFFITLDKDIGSVRTVHSGVAVTLDRVTIHR